MYLREWFRVLENYYMIAYGLAALAFLIVAPYGLVGAIERARISAVRTRPRRAASGDVEGAAQR